MSAFLGPVHYWLYRKIQYQEQLNQRFLKEFVPSLMRLLLRNVAQFKMEV